VQRPAGRAGLGATAPVPDYLREPGPLAAGRLRELRDEKNPSRSSAAARSSSSSSICAVLGNRSLTTRATRHARTISRSSASMVSMSRTPGSSLKCFRFRPKARALPLARRAALLCPRCSVSSSSSGEPRASQIGVDRLKVAHAAARRSVGAGRHFSPTPANPVTTPRRKNPGWGVRSRPPASRFFTHSPKSFGMRSKLAGQRSMGDRTELGCAVMMTEQPAVPEILFGAAVRALSALVTANLCRATFLTAGLPGSAIAHAASNLQTAGGPPSVSRDRGIFAQSALEVCFDALNTAMRQGSPRSGSGDYSAPVVA
jgi:hypothetical protein